MDLHLSNKSKPDKSDTLKLDTIQGETRILNLTKIYIYWLILIFTPIAKITRLASKQFGTIIICDSMTE